MSATNSASDVPGDDSKKKLVMVWNDQKDATMLREIAARGIMHLKQKSRERGAAWQSLADDLCPILSYRLTARAVRDRFGIIVKRFKAAMAKEKRATGGGGVELDERGKSLEELIEVDEDMEQLSTEEIGKRQAEKEQAQDMRAIALERFGETRKRKEGNEGSSMSKKRRKSGEVMDWLKEKLEYEERVREQELYEKREKREKEASKHQELLEVIATTQQQAAAQMQANQQYIQHQDEQHQQQFAMLQQQMMLFMQQQHQQTELIASLLKKEK